MYQVLVVEDELAIRFIYRNMKEWEQNGFSITAEAETGKKALELLNTESFDIMLLDVVLPEMDGLELLEALEERYVHIPVVIASTYNEFEYARKGMQLGAMDYLVKPIQNEELDECLKKVAKKLSGKTETQKEMNEIQKIFVDCGLNPELSFVQKLEKYMETGEELSLGKIAAYFELSKDYFGKVFHQRVGCSFQQFVIKYKMETAKHLLRETNLKVYEISEQLGYKTVDHFTRLFRDYAGISPQKFRKEGSNH